MKRSIRAGFTRLPGSRGKSSMKVALAATVFAVVATAGTTGASAQTSRLQTSVDAAVAAGSPGAVASVRVGDKSWSDASGFADVVTQERAVPESSMRIGSITKPMVATVIMQLTEEGRLTLDDSVERHLPGLLANGNEITVRHLLSHTSGLPEYISKIDTDGNNFEAVENRNFTAEELIDLALTGEPQPTAPGTFDYANTNYVIAGMLIEKIGGQPISEALRHRIFLAAGMNHSIYRQADPNISGPHLRGYMFDPAGDGALEDTTSYTPTLIQGAGAVISTAGDVSMFLDALFDGELVSRESLAVMTDMSATGFYGLGITRLPVDCAPGGYVYGHGGSLFGYNTIAMSTIDGQKQATMGLNSMAVSQSEPPEVLASFVEANICG